MRSVMELLSIPLYGPGTQTPALTGVSAAIIPAGGLTQSLAPRDIPTANLSTLAIEVPSLLPPTPSAGAPAYIPLVAQAKFFRPQYPQGANPPQGLAALQIAASLLQLFGEPLERHQALESLRHRELQVGANQSTIYIALVKLDNGIGFHHLPSYAFANPSPLVVD